MTVEAKLKELVTSAFGKGAFLKDDDDPIEEKKAYIRDISKKFWDNVTTGQLNYFVTGVVSLRFGKCEDISFVEKNVLLWNLKQSGLSFRNDIDVSSEQNYYVVSVPFDFIYKEQFNKNRSILKYISDIIFNKK